MNKRYFNQKSALRVKTLHGMILNDDLYANNCTKMIYTHKSLVRWICITNRLIFYQCTIAYICLLLRNTQYMFPACDLTKQPELSVFPTDFGQIGLLTAKENGLSLIIRV